MGCEGAVKYVIYQDSRGGFRVQAVAVEPGSFTSRRALPEAWRGVRGADLDQATPASVPEGCVFVHAAGFIGGHKTREGAVAMVQAALAM
jgi:uncharacterized UPF0160 family protein